MSARTVARPNLFVILLASSGAFSAGCNTMDERPAVWEYISPAIFQPNCATASCHSPGAAVAGLDFSDPDRGYTSLTGLWVWIVDPTGTLDNNCLPSNGTVVCQRNHRPMVTPFDPAQSRVVNMLRARDAPRMPSDRPLSEADIELVEKWILNGATKVADGVVPTDAGGEGHAVDGGADTSATDATGGKS